MSHFPQKNTKNRVYHLPRGKMLGGSSAINFMAYGRPCAEDIDDWSSKLGISGWSWDDLLPYFKRSERLTSDLSNGLEDSPLNSNYHGVDGSIITSLPPWQLPFEKTLLPTLDEVSGIARPADPNSGYHQGFFRSIFTIDRTTKPTRSYAGSGYLAPNIGRSNLKVLTNTVANRVILQRSPDRSYQVGGVEVQHKGKSYVLKARKEIILSAGTFQSPQLLELSGIGDPGILQGANIPCLVPNSDVGNNLQEHTMSAVVYELAPGFISLDSLKDPEVFQEHQRLYNEHNSGALSGIINLFGYIPFSSQVNSEQLEETLQQITEASPTVDSDSRPQNVEFQRKQQEAIVARMRNPKAADTQIVGSPAFFNIAKGYNHVGQLMTGPPPDHNACYSLVLSNMYPLSRGSVHVRSANVSDAPLIDPGFLSHPADVDVLAAGIKFADRVFKSDRLKDSVIKRVDPPLSVNLDNVEEARAFVRERIVSYHHALGTCAMGQVVDSRLRVKGVHGLRVVDASVMPMQVSTAILATIYAVAEKAADLIKEDHGLLTRSTSK